MTTEQSHEASAEHSCGCGHDHGESHESPKPQEVVVESPQPQTQSGKLITITAKAAEKISECVDDIFENKAKFVAQDKSKATYAKKIEKNEGQIDWNEKAQIIIGKINGLFPIPGAFFNFNGERYKVLKAEIGSGIGATGEVLSEKLEIACGNNQSIKVIEIQRQGKRSQKIGEFMLGSQIKKGSVISNV